MGEPGYPRGNALRPASPVPTAPVPRRLDVRGLICPLPITLTAREIGKMAAGETLEVLGDDPDILADMPAWCQETGHRLLAVDLVAGVIRCLVEKAPASG